MENGAKGEFTYTVRTSDLASEVAVGSEDEFPEVLATSKMIGLMEVSAARLMKPLLKEGELSVGVGVDIGELRDDERDGREGLQILADETHTPVESAQSLGGGPVDVATGKIGRLHSLSAGSQKVALGDGRRGPGLSGWRWGEPGETRPYLWTKGGFKCFRDGNEPVAKGCGALPGGAVSALGQVGLAVYLEVPHSGPDERFYRRSEGIHELLWGGGALAGSWAEELDQEGVDPDIPVGGQVGSRVDDGPQF